ncbi:hypothetical protein U1Q18_033493 [Sarracenia purpurea var. burkii]
MANSTFNCDEPSRIFLFGPQNSHNRSLSLCDLTSRPSPLAICHRRLLSSFVACRNQPVVLAACPVKQKQSASDSLALPSCSILLLLGHTMKSKQVIRFEMEFKPLAMGNEVIERLIPKSKKEIERCIPVTNTSEKESRVVEIERAQNSLLLRRMRHDLH